ncbi:response regulator [Paraburkholderia sp. B3]|uniref:response regulator n=1 Tax=Paraburkholderia sp. B3 TaxID=3134791 RepID=UPI00398236E1
MNAMAGWLRNLNQRIDDTWHMSAWSARAVGVIGTIGHPVYWLWWTYVDPKTNESLTMRAIGTLACALLLLRRFWPAATVRFQPWYYFVTVAYTLPFFFTVYLVTSHYSMVWSMAEVGMMFFLMAIFPSFLVLALNLSIGVGLAILWAWIAVPESLRVDAHLLLYTYLPVFAFGIAAGLSFSYSNMMGLTAQAKNEALRALAGTIAQEMRNPLSQLRYVLDRVEEALATTGGWRSTPALPPEGAVALSRHLAHGQLAIDRGLRIIAMALDEVRARPLRPDNFSYASAAAITRKALEEYGFANRKERSRVRLVVIEDFTFKVDETAWLFTLFNLIRNALHHMAAHPEATLTLTVDRQKVIVHDTGPGIAPELMPHLFEPFRTQGESAGAGLGLAYCQRAMRSFGGTIGCRSEPGKYTQFTLEFPLVAESEIAAYRQQVLARAAHHFGGKRILVVDDDASRRARVGHALSDVNAEVAEAGDGEQALALLREASHYDAVLMDVDMPGLDGYAATEKLRAERDSPNRNVLVAGYAAEPNSLARVLARSAGMDDTIGKSSGMVELIHALQMLMENGDRHHRTPKFGGFAGKTIVVADDDTYSRMVAKSYLERCGATVVEAENGQGVLARLQAGGTIDAVVLDMNMPGMGGVETAAWLRERSDVFGRMPIVAMTGYSDMEAVRSCLAAGMNEVMIKPVRVGALYACLARQFALASASQALEREGVSASSAARAGMSVPDGPDDLLDEAQLEELASLDMLDQSFVNGIAQIRVLLTQLPGQVRVRDRQAAQAALHRLLGVSGNIGARALHAYVKQIYPQVLDGQWPAQMDWPERMVALGARSADALQRYFDTATTTAIRDQRDVTSGD